MKTVQQPGVPSNSHGFSALVLGLGGRNYMQTFSWTRVGGAHRGAQERHAAATPTRRAAWRPPRAAGPPYPTQRQVDSVAMKRKPRLSLLQTATRQISAIMHPP